MLFVDLDHFKHINDQNGHVAGDEVLRCPDTTREQAAILAEKLRTTMTTQDWPHGLRLTASFGATALKPDEDIGTAIARADGASYVAKSKGRNRVEVA